MESKKEYKAKVAQLCLTLCDPMDCSPPGSSINGIGKNFGMGCHFLLQETSIQVWNPHLHCQVDALPLASPGGEEELKRLDEGKGE